MNGVSFSDTVSKEVIFGKEKNTIGFSFIGFMYEFRYDATVYSAVSNFMASGCGEGYCNICPRGPTCLISCPGDSYLSEDGVCSPCKESCSSCIRGSDCNLCSDLLCSICPRWDICEECG